MLLRRLGNKKKIATKIQEYFPPHKTYIEPFFGAGGMLFYKPKAKYNIVNDLDSEVFNLYQIVKNKHKELKEAFNLMPISSDLFNFFKKNTMDNDIDRAIRFLFLSNFGYMGKTDTMRLNNGNTKKLTSENIKKTFDFIFDIEFSNLDFEKFLNAIPFKDNKNRGNTFIYCDPPYLETANNYAAGFQQADVLRLFDVLEQLKCKFAYSEFDNDFIISEAKKRNLNINIIGERINMKNRRTEILITNYKNNPTLF